MKKIIILLSLFSIGFNSYSQLNLGMEFTQTTNKFLESNTTSLVSDKFITYLNYKFKKLIVEGYYSEDVIPLINGRLVRYAEYYEYGVLFGGLNRYLDSKNFNTSIGLYNRKYSKNQNITYNYGNKIGVTLKIQFGLEFVKGLNTGITYRVFQDIYNLKENQSKLLLNQSSFSFVLEVDLFEFFRKLSSKISGKENE